MSIKEFKEKGYTLLKNVINTELRDVATQYALFDEMQDFNADTVQVIGAHSKYADPLMESILLHFLPLMEENTGLKLYPTYSFYRVYRNGDVLESHTDRPSCEISATVCFNYSYDDSKYTWPIIMDGNKVEMNPGDIVIYRGVDLEHSREEFNPPGDNWHVQAFIHYVNAGGQYSEWKNDKRETIGQKKNTKKKGYIEYVN